MTNNEEQYLQLLRLVLEKGKQKGDRTGTGTISVFGAQARFDLRQNFPLLTTKKVHLKSVIYELLWFLRGDTNIKWLNSHNVNIWNEWADKEGNLGRVYGAQWRSWRTGDGATVDQIANVVQRIKENPNDRRLIVTAWNPGEIHLMALPPCHCLFQFYVADGELSCHLYQRSCDLFLGVPFNIASYALLTTMIAAVCGLKVGEFIHTYGDLHIYNNHIEQVKEQLQRTLRPGPQLQINATVPNMESFVYEDFKLVGYDPHPSIKAPIAV